MTLNSEGLLPCPFCGCNQIVVYYDHPETVGPVVGGGYYISHPLWKEYPVSWGCKIQIPVYFATKELAIAAWNRRALPPVDGLEVVAWDVAPKGLPAEPTKSHSFVAEIEKQGGVILPLVTLSQASSVIAGLTKERDEALRRESSSIMGEIEATQRISSLEEENKRLREIVKAVAHIGVDFGFGPYELEAHFIEDARQALGDHNG